MQGLQDAPDPIAGGVGALGGQRSVDSIVNQVPVIQLPPQPSAPPQPQAECVRPESTVLLHVSEGASTSSSEPQSQRQVLINVGLLRIEFGELVDGTINSNRLRIYNKREMQYIMKVAMIRAIEALNELKRVVEEHVADISGNRNMRRA